MFQMISNGSIILCYGNSGSRNIVSNVHKKQLHEVNNFTKEDINKMEHNILRNMKLIKEKVSNDDKQLFLFHWSNNSITWTKENIPNNILPTTEVLNELLPNNKKDFSTKKKERTTEIKSTKAKYDNNYNNAEQIEEEGAEVPTET